MTARKATAESAEETQRAFDVGEPARRLASTRQSEPKGKPLRVTPAGSSTACPWVPSVVAAPRRGATSKALASALFLRVLCVLCGLPFVACVTHRVTLPVGPGRPFAEFQQAFQEATASCRAIHTLTAELRLSGRAGAQRLRGRLLAGLAEPSSMRLEALAPFGPPAFILVGRSDRATLLFPKDDLVLRNERPAAVLSALAGIALDPGDLRVALTGCGTTAVNATAGRTYAGGWVAVEADGVTLYLRKAEGTWRTLAAATKGWNLEYRQWLNGLPRQVRLMNSGDAQAGRPGIDLNVEVVDLRTNIKLEAAAFDLEVSSSARPLTLDELRRLGPLGDRK